MADLRTGLARWLDLPEAASLDLPQLRCIGDLQVLIENHLGVRSFRDGVAIVATRIGPLEIWGQELTVGAVDRDAILVTGRIEGMRYQRG